MIYLKFNTEENIYSFFASTNTNREAWFISFIGQDYDGLTTYELLNKLKNNSSVSVRLISDCGQVDYKFPLSGSSNAINFVASEWIETNRRKHVADSIKAENIRKQKLAEELERQKELQQIEKQYKSLITFGDNLLKKKSYQASKEKYNEALKLKPNESYPKNQILLIDRKLFQNEIKLKTFYYKETDQTKYFKYYDELIKIVKSEFQDFRISTKLVKLT